MGMVIPRHFVEFFHIRKLSESLNDLTQSGRFDENVYED
jgi:hypothetical protein